MSVPHCKLNVCVVKQSNWDTSLFNAAEEHKINENFKRLVCNAATSAQLETLCLLALATHHY